MSFRSKALLEVASPLLLAKRFRGKINIQRPRAPHHERAKFLELTKPYFPSIKSHIPLFERCSKNVQKQTADKEDNPFQKIIAKECLNWFNHSKLVAIFHCNPISSEEKFKAKLALKRQNLHWKDYGKSTLEIALDGTPFASLLQYHRSQNAIVFSPEGKIKPMLTVLKRFPQLILIYGVFENRFLSRDELLKLSQYPDLLSAQASLVQMFNSPASQLVEKLTSQQLNLMRLLDERAKQLK